MGSKVIQFQSSNLLLSSTCSITLWVMGLDYGFGEAKFVEMMLLPTETGRSPLLWIASVISVQKAATVFNGKTRA